MVRYERRRGRSAGVIMSECACSMVVRVYHCCSQMIAPLILYSVRVLGLSK